MKLFNGHLFLTLSLLSYKIPTKLRNLYKLIKIELI